MTSSPFSTAQAEQLQWLVDREAIRNLVYQFGVSIDDQDKEGFAATFTEDGVLEAGWGGRIEGRGAIATMTGMPSSWRTQHLFGNILIDVSGDRATARAYMVATHVFDTVDITQHARAGGWYEQELVRTADGWRFAHVKLIIVWAGARPMSDTLEV